MEDRILVALVALGALLIPAQASAVEVSPEKQSAMNARGWSATDSLTVAPVPTEAGDGRSCERGKARVAIKNQNGNPDVQVWTMLTACERNGRCVELHARYGQGSSGKGWARKSPLSFPWVQASWVDRFWLYKSRIEVLYEYGPWDAPWNLAARIQANCATNEIRFKRETSVR